MISSLELPMRMREVGVPADSLQELARSAMEDRSFGLNPGRTTPEEVLHLLYGAY